MKTLESQMRPALTDAQLASIEEQASHAGGDYGHDDDILELVAEVRRCRGSAARVASGCEGDVPQTIRCAAPGSGIGDMCFDVRVHSCGGVADGIAMSFGQECGWVVSFADVERVYRAAAKYRNSPDGQRWLTEARRRA